MERLEKLILPISLVVAACAFFLATANPDVAVLVGQTFGVILVLLIVVGGVMRVRMKLRQARELQDAIDTAHATDSKSPGGD